MTPHIANAALAALEDLRSRVRDAEFALRKGCAAAFQDKCTQVGARYGLHDSPLFSDNQIYYTDKAGYEVALGMISGGCRNIRTYASRRHESGLDYLVSIGAHDVQRRA